MRISQQAAILLGVSAWKNAEPAAEHQKINVDCVDSRLTYHSKEIIVEKTPLAVPSTDLLGLRAE
jgi:hypothetical protein